MIQITVSRLLVGFILVLFVMACGDVMSDTAQSEVHSTKAQAVWETELYILGTMQDGGLPHIGCQKSCCAQAFKEPNLRRSVVSLGLFDGLSKKRYLFEATPDMPEQLAHYNSYLNQPFEGLIDGVFLTHAHMGHYTGLMYFGKEAKDSENIKVYAMDRMSSYLKNNGPWSQLVARKNIELVPMEADRTQVLSDQLSVTPLLVPHRDEFSETVGWLIKGPNKTALFVPDIDKWPLWERSLVDLLQEVDYAFLDATFFSGAELDNRPMDQVPHPSISETMELLSALPKSERQKVHFIHYNHTNPVLDGNSHAAQKVLEAGFHLTQLHQRFPL